MIVSCSRSVQKRQFVCAFVTVLGGHGQSGRCPTLGDSLRGRDGATYYGASFEEVFVLPAMRRAEISRCGKWERGARICLDARSAGNREEVHSDLP